VSPVSTIGRGPEHACSKTAAGELPAVTDREALDAFHLLTARRHHSGARVEHAVAYAAKLAPTMRRDQIILINLSGAATRHAHGGARRHSPMSRLATRFSSCALRAQGLIPFVTRATRTLGHRAADARARRRRRDAIELGVPFSDPMADGPVIQRASERALVHHTSLRDVLDMVASSPGRRADARVLMGYLTRSSHGLSALRRGGRGRRRRRADRRLPPTRGTTAGRAARVDLDPIYLIAPTSSPARIEKICSAASGFVYYVSLKGVTGAAHLDLGRGAEARPDPRANDASVGVGFGIRDAALPRAWPHRRRRDRGQRAGEPDRGSGRSASEIAPALGACWRDAQRNGRA